MYCYRIMLRHKEIIMGTELTDGNRKIYMVFNPVAGMGRIKNNLADIVEIFTRAGYESTVRASGGRGNALSFAREFNRKEYDLFVCCGGDGTLDEVVSGVMERNDRTDGEHVRVGYIPAGSTNDFAMSLGIPSDMSEAAKVIVNGRDVMCDIGGFNKDRHFVYVAAFGLFTDISYTTPQDQKNMFGHSAYIMRVLPALLKMNQMHPYHIRVTSDDRFFEDDYAVGMVTNSRSVGGFEGITGKHVDLQDGLFEVTMIKMPTNPIETNQILQSLLQSDLGHCSLITHFKTSKLVVESEKELSWTCDGEYGGAHEKAVLKALRQELCIRVPFDKNEKLQG